MKATPPPSLTTEEAQTIVDLLLYSSNLAAMHHDATHSEETEVAARWLAKRANIAIIEPQEVS